MKNLCTRGFFMPLLALILCMGLASTPAFAAEGDEAESQVTTVADVESGDIENEELTEPNEGDDKEPTTSENGDTETGEGDTSDAECTCGTEDGTHDENCPQHKAPEVDPADGGDETDGNVTTEPGQDGDTSDAECNCTPAEDGTHDENCPQHKAPEVDPADTENDEDPEPAVCTCTTKCGETGNSECPVCAAGGECKATSSNVKWDEETGTLTITGTSDQTLTADGLTVNGEAITNLKPNHLVIDGFGTVGNGFSEMTGGLASLEIKNVGTIGSGAFNGNGNDELKVTISDSGLNEYLPFYQTKMGELELNNVTVAGGAQHSQPSQPFRGAGSDNMKVTINGGNLEIQTLQELKMSELTLNNVDIADNAAFLYKAGNANLKVTVNGGSLGTNAFNSSTMGELVLNNVTIKDGTENLFKNSHTDGLKVTVNGGSFGSYVFSGGNMSELVLNGVTIADGTVPFFGAGSDNMKVTVNDSTLGYWALGGVNMSEVTLNNTTAGNSVFLWVKDGLKVYAYNSNLTEYALDGNVTLYVKDGVIVKATTDSLQDLIDKSEGKTELVISGVIHSTGDSIRIGKDKDITLVTNGEAASIEADDNSNNSLFVIENGGKLTIADDNLTIKGAANAKPGNYTATVFQVKGTLDLDKGTIIGGGDPLSQSSITGAIVLNEGAKFNMRGGKITGTTLGGFHNAPVVVNANSVFNMSGGQITGNYNYGSGAAAGAVLVCNWNTVREGANSLSPWSAEDPYAIMNLTGGEISHNTTEYSRGGAVIVIGNAALYMNGGKITDNTSRSGYGGGITVMGNSPSMRDTYDAHCIFTMDGGEISGNSARYGGGIYVNSNYATLNAGLIANNTASETGGGIYVETPDVNPTSAQLNNAVIHGNHATVMGGGMYFCPTGSSEQYVNGGPAIFDNTADGAADDLVSVALPNEPEDGKFVIVTERILGGGKVDWYLDGEVEELIANGWGHVVEGSERYDAETYAELVAAGKYQNIALKAIVSENAKQLALASGKLIITGNQAKRGGGVGSNGNVTIGDKNAPEYELNIDKVWEGVSEGEKKPVIIQLVIDGVKLDTIELSAENGWSASFTGLSEDLKDKLSVIELTTGYTVSYSELSEDGETLHITVTNSPIPQTPDPDPEPPTPDPDPEPPAPEEEIPDVDVPLGEPPEEEPDEEPEVEIPDVDVPLGNVPQTGDNSAIWYVLAVLSVSGLAVLALVEKRKEQEG